MRLLSLIVLCLLACTPPPPVCPTTPEDKNITEEERRALGSIDELEHAARALYAEQERVAAHETPKAADVKALTQRTRAAYEAEQRLAARLEAAIRRNHAMPEHWTWDARTGAIIKTPVGRVRAVVPPHIAPVIPVDAGVACSCPAPVSEPVIFDNMKVRYKSSAFSPIIPAPIAPRHFDKVPAVR